MINSVQSGLDPYFLSNFQGPDQALLGQTSAASTLATPEQQGSASTQGSASAPAPVTSDNALAELQASLLASIQSESGNLPFENQIGALASSLESSSGTPSGPAVAAALGSLLSSEAINAFQGAASGSDSSDLSFENSSGLEVTPPSSL